MTITEIQPAPLSDDDRVKLEQLGINVPNVPTYTELIAYHQLLLINGRLQAQVAMTDEWIAAASSLQSERDTLSFRVGQYQENISIIGDRLLAEAKDRGWCSDFDAIVKDLNESMHAVDGGLLKTRKFTKRVRFEATIEIEGTGTGSNLGPMVNAWAMGNLDNTESLIERGENWGVDVESSVVIAVNVIDD